MKIPDRAVGAKEKGFCDHILGVDCELDEIV